MIVQEEFLILTAKLVFSKTHTDYEQIMEGDIIRELLEHSMNLI